MSCDLLIQGLPGNPGTLVEVFIKARAFISSRQSTKAQIAPLQTLTRQACPLVQGFHVAMLACVR